MPKRTFFRLTALLFVLSLLVSLVSVQAEQAHKRGRKYKAPPATARIEITVIRDHNEKPIVNAAVVFHPMEGERDKGNMELKTNDEGKTVIDVLPIGDTVRLQVIAKGFQTHGQDFKVDKPEMAFTIRMRRPGQQYSIYKAHPDHPESAPDAGGKPAETPNPDQPQPKPKN